MDEIEIRLTEDELVRLLEIAGRLVGGGWLGDLTELWTEFSGLLLGHIEGEVSPDLRQRFHDVLNPLIGEHERVRDLENLYRSPEDDHD